MMIAWMETPYRYACKKMIGYGSDIGHGQRFNNGTNGLIRSFDKMNKGIQGGIDGPDVDRQAMSEIEETVHQRHPSALATPQRSP